VRRGIADFRENGTEIRKITIIGGAAKSATWCQIIADAAGVTIERLNQADVCALGAAAIALCGAGIYPDYQAAAGAMVHPQAQYAPDARAAAWYDAKFQKFDSMWRHMRKYCEENA
jgi:sugar (pentulose or hexulose) kinase